MVTDVQRRHIEYWKLRSEQCSHKDDTARERLTRAFRSANAGNEEVAYWTQIVEENDGEETCQMLFEAFEANEDMTGAYQFWKSRIGRSEIEYWNSVFLRKLTGTTSGASFSTREVMNICKVMLQRDPSYYWAADAFVETSKSLTDMEARITHLRTALDTLNLSFDVSKGYYESDEVEIARSFLVKGLAEVVMKKGEENYAVGFWTTLVRKCPSSWPISEALHRAFVANGDDQAAMQFWGKMRRVSEEQHFAYFYAESCQNAGKFEEAMKIWWLWLDYFLSKAKFPERQVFSRQTIVKSLNAAINFDYELPDIIEIWEASLKKYPPKDPHDERQECLATAFLHYSNQFALHKAHRLLQKAAEMCPYREEIIRQLRSSFKTTNISRFEGLFWKSHIESTRSLSKWQRAWYYVRSAQFYSGIEAYKDVRRCIKQVIELQPYEDVMEAVRILNIGSNVREFWRLVVMSTPEHSCVEQLEAVCFRSQSDLSSDIEMWQSLIRGNLSNYYLTSKLQSAYQIGRRDLLIIEEIEFWKECIRSKRTRAQHLCNALVDTYKWKRDHDAPDPSTAFDEEISMWRTLLLEQAPEYGVDWDDYNGIPGQLDRSIKAKADAIGDNLWSVIEVWKNAKDLWQLIYFYFQGRSVEIKSETKKRMDDASGILQLLERDSRASI